MDVKTKRHIIMGSLALIGILVVVGIIYGVFFFTAPERPATRQAPSPAQQTSSQQLASDQPRDISLRTDDGVRLAGTYYPASGEGVVLLHMLGEDRHSWDDFATKLQREGYAVLSIDLRGHGESDRDWRDFRYPSGETREADNDFLDMVLDVKATKKYVNEQGKFATNIVGASISANIAVLYAETDPRVKRIVLLSPGLNYRGVDLPAGPLYNGKVLMVAATEDEYSARTVDTYARRIRGEYKTTTYPGNAHGTELLEEEPDLAGRIIAWLKK